MAEETPAVETTGNVGDLIANTPVTPEADNSAATEETPPVEPVKEEVVKSEEKVEEPKTDKRDFQAYSKKLEAENKELRTLYKERQQTVPPAPVSEPADITPDEEAMNLLQQMVKQPVNEAISPLTEERVWDDFEKQPFVADLKPEIAEELAKLSESLPLQERLDTARKNAIVNNLGMIAKVYKEIGQDEAYGNQQLKKTNTGLGATPTSTGQQQSVVDRVLAGETVSEAEYRDSHAEIQEAMRKQAMGT